MFEALDDGMAVLLDMVGVAIVWLVSSCTAQRALSGVLSLCATEPIGRRLHETWAWSKSGTTWHCADDVPLCVAQGFSGLWCRSLLHQSGSRGCG